MHRKTHDARSWAKLSVHGAFPLLAQRSRRSQGQPPRAEMSSTAFAFSHNFPARLLRFGTCSSRLGGLRAAARYDQRVERHRASTLGIDDQWIDIDLCN